MSMGKLATIRNSTWCGIPASLELCLLFGHERERVVLNPIIDVIY